MNLSFWLRRPHLIPARIQYWVWEKLNWDKPWLCAGTIRYCEKYLSLSMTGLEFGSGRSTQWFARRLRRLVSVEHSEAWYLKTKAELTEQKIHNVEYRLIPLDHPENAPEKAVYDLCPSYVAVLDEFNDEELDLIVVDGHYRTTCVKRCFNRLKHGGILLVDDVNLWPSIQELQIPDSWHLVDSSRNGIKHTCIWQKA